jgi:hypothetical protein
MKRHCDALVFFGASWPWKSAAGTIRRPILWHRRTFRIERLLTAH